MLFLIIIAIGLLFCIISKWSILGPLSAGSYYLPLPLGLWLDCGSVNDDGTTHFFSFILSSVLSFSFFPQSISDWNRKTWEAPQICSGLHFVLDPLSPPSWWSDSLSPNTSLVPSKGQEFTLPSPLWCLFSTDQLCHMRGTELATC